MAASILKRDSYRPDQGIPMIGDIRLTSNRVHELCGPARRRLAVMIASEMAGPIFWIRSAWETDQLYVPALPPLVDPGRITLVKPKRLVDVLWAMEEVLRSGAAPLCVAELPEPPALTPMRRLNLALEAAHDRYKTHHLGLLLTPGDGGAQGAESRWHMKPAHKPHETGWHLSRRRARMEPPKEWHVVWQNGLPTLAG